MNGIQQRQGFWRKLPPTLLRQYAPVQNTDPYQYYYTFPASSHYEYSNNYVVQESKDGKRKKVKKKKEGKKKRVPIGVTIRYVPPPLTVAQMVSFRQFCIIITVKGFQDGK